MFKASMDVTKMIDMRTIIFKKINCSFFVCLFLKLDSYTALLYSTVDAESLTSDINLLYVICKQTFQTLTKTSIATKTKTIRNSMYPLIFR